MASFLPHYLDRLGFEHVQFIYGDENDPKWLTDYIKSSGYGDRTSLLIPDQHADIHTILNFPIPELSRRVDWIVFADMDEYLYLGGESIADVLALHWQKKVVHFRWFMASSGINAPADAPQLLQSASIFRKRFSKTAFQPQGISHIDDHEPFWKQGPDKSEIKLYEILSPAEHPCFYYHFCSRGLFDQLMKCIYFNSGSRNPKTANHPLLREFLAREGDVASINQVPTRFLILMMQQKEDQSSDPVISEICRHGQQLFSGMRFDLPMLNEMMLEGLELLELPGTTINAIMDQELLQTCLQRITDRFWDESMLHDLRFDNYLTTLRKWRRRSSRRA